MPGFRSVIQHRSNYVGVWSAFRRTDLDHFVDEHARLYSEAETSGDFSAVTAAYYSVMSDLIDRSFGPNWHFFPPQQQGQSMRRAITAGHEQLAAKLPLVAGQRGIDVGSGVGGWMRYIARRTGADFVGVSIGKAEVEAANRRHRSAGLDKQCTTLCADAVNMPFEDNSFDGGSAIYALKYFSDPRPVLREIARVLKPGAAFISYNIVRTATLDPQAADPDPARRFEYATGMPRLRTAAEMITAAEACGLSCVENTDVTGTAPWYHYIEANPLLPVLVGSKTIKGGMRALERIRVLPPGCARFQETFLDGTVLGLLHAGRQGVLAGSNVLVFRKVEDGARRGDDVAGRRG